MTLARRRRGAAALLIALLLVAGLGRPAAAHDDTGVITVAEASPAGGTSVAFTVDVTYTNDGHGAVGATVTVAADGAGGATVGPVPMAPAGPQGRYQATVEFPTGGTWAVRFSSLSPLATLEVAQEVAGGATTTTTAPTTSTTTASTSTTTAGPATTAVVGPTTEPVVTTAAVPTSAPGDDDGDDGGGPGIWPIVVAVILAGGAGYLFRRWRSSKS